MVVDWFTVAAQAVNFLLLVLLLRHFLYTPILNAVDARETLIADELAAAAASKADAAKEHADFDAKNAEFDEQVAAKMAEVEQAAAVEKKRLLEVARTAADALSDKRRVALVNEARSLNEAVSRRTVDEVFAITRKVLADLASTNLEEHIGAAFIRRLAELDDAARTEVSRAIASGSGGAVVRSAFDLSPDQQAMLRSALNETFSTDVAVRFETAPALISGIELSANGQKVGWSVAEYLGSLHEGITALLVEGAGTQTKSTPSDAGGSTAARGVDHAV